MRECPTKFAIKLFKKWSIEVVRDIWFGKRRFSEILEANPGLSSKVLSQRLKELENYGIIKKSIIRITPLKAEYMLTEKGQALNKIMFDLALFSFEYYSKELFEKNPPTRDEMAKATANIFKIHKESV